MLKLQAQTVVICLQFLIIVLLLETDSYDFNTNTVMTLKVEQLQYFVK